MTEVSIRATRRRRWFDPLAPANNPPIVVALCSDEAQGITGQVFHIFGGAVNMLVPWSAGELFSNPKAGWRMTCSANWSSGFRIGIAPTGLIEMLEKVGGSYTPK